MADTPGHSAAARSAPLRRSGHDTSMNAVLELDSAATTPGLRPRRWLLAAALALAGAFGLWQGGIAGLAGGAAWAGVTALLLPRRATAAAPADEAPVTVHNRVGAEVMVSQVVPVWSRQLEVTRDACGEGLGKILETFAALSAQMQQLADTVRGFSPSADATATDGALQSAAPALNKLQQASARAFAERDAAVAELGDVVQRLADLKHLAKTARELARHTRLVAFNASIEANRGGRSADGGGAAVATEVRMLATRFAETGEQIERIVGTLSAAAEARHRQAQTRDTTPEELQLEIGLHAREALAALLAGLGGALQGAGEIERAGAELAAQIDATFVHFQFGDRVAQMLAIVGNDMNHFARWVAENPRATQGDAATWLARLESSYTMEEQRSHHHGNVHVAASSGVEFF